MAITKEILAGVKTLGPDLGFIKSDVSARCLHAARANALLLANVDTDIVRLIDHWLSNKMLRYIHIQAALLMPDYSHQILNAGCYRLMSKQSVYVHWLPAINHHQHPVRTTQLHGMFMFFTPSFGLWWQ